MALVGKSAPTCTCANASWKAARIPSFTCAAAACCTRWSAGRDRADRNLLLPHADLKLAHVLKCPIFGCSDGTCYVCSRPILRSDARWERLRVLATEPGCPATLARALAWLTRWRAHCGALPVTTCSDRVYFEGDLEARYAAAVPEAMRRRCCQPARLHAAGADADAGRYPNAGRLRP